MSASSSRLAPAPADAVGHAASALVDAWRSRVPCAPVRPLIEAFGIEGAYAVQKSVIGLRRADGRSIVGRKIGLTSQAIQQQLGVEQPDFGVLLDDMEWADAAEIPAGVLIQPRVEAEVAFVLERDLDMEAPSLAQVLRAVAYALPAIEVVDSRVRDWNISIWDTVADNASAGVYVLGGAPKRLESLDLQLCGMSLENRGEPLAVGCGMACLGNPLNALVWLARRVAQLGQPLRAGEVVLSGALGPMVRAVPGETYEARIAGLGSVRAVFGAGAVPAREDG